MRGGLGVRVERIGDATLYLGDCREVLPTLGRVDGPYLELFARQAWPKGDWTAWGNQVGKFAPEAAA